MQNKTRATAHYHRARTAYERRQHVPVYHLFLVATMMIQYVSIKSVSVTIRSYHRPSQSLMKTNGAFSATTIDKTARCFPRDRRSSTKLARCKQTDQNVPYMYIHVMYDLDVKSELLSTYCTLMVSMSETVYCYAME
jgi:hypothetical protein